MPDIPRHSQAKLHPSKLVTIGILFALKGGFFRAFYRWLERDYGDWFGDGTLPERTRLQRLLKTHQDWCKLLMADPTFLASLRAILTTGTNCGFKLELFCGLVRLENDDSTSTYARDFERNSLSSL